MIEAGMIGFSSSKTWFGKLVKFFTESKWSHCFVVGYPYKGLSEEREMVFEANNNVMLTPFDINYRSNPEMSYEIYRIKNLTDAPQSTIDKMVEDILFNFIINKSAIQYGYTQLLYFVWAWIRAKIGLPLNPAKSPNWFKSGLICSGLEFDFWIMYKALCKFIEGKYQYNTIPPEAFYEIVQQNALLFELVESKYV